MNPMFASGLFDNPWLALIFIVVGLISNWLMKRRQGSEEEGTSTPPPLTPAKPQEEFDLERSLRRLLGEEPKSPAPAPPPVILHSPRSQPPLVAEWEEGAESDSSGQRRAEEFTATKTPTPPPVSAPQSRYTVSQAVEQYEAAARQISQLTLSRNVAAAGAISHRPSSSRAGHQAEHWRHPVNARHAFIASLVFGPPKGMES